MILKAFSKIIDGFFYFLSQKGGVYEVKRGDIKAERVMASKPSQNKSFRELGEEIFKMFRNKRF